MLAFFLGAALLFGSGVFWYPPYGFVLVGALFLTVLGVADDNWTLSVRLRFFAYGFCCVVVAAALLRGAIPDASLLLIFSVASAMLWALNLYNFMDGVDGIASTQCFLACCSAALLVWSVGGASDYVLFCLLFGVSHLGFLVWNWPAARLFMGDAGSIPTGFTLAALAVLGGAQGYLSVACWLVLLGVFITDASWTLTRRVITGQKFTQAHRSHAYQRLSRRWGSHQSVVVLLILINVSWLFPLAWSIVLWPQHTITLVILAYLPLLVGMAKIPDIA
ncbi:MAG: Fuc2NAc and GlcNAc transferase [Halioglobus sp.]|jgi:Fuc2NAc and GlcNAc transferase